MKRPGFKQFKKDVQELEVVPSGIEIFKEFTECIIDSKIADETLKSVPVVSIIFAFAKAGIGTKKIIEKRDLQRVIENIESNGVFNDLDEDKKRSIISKLEDKTKQGQIIAALTAIFDALEEKERQSFEQDLFENLYMAYIDGKIEDRSDVSTCSRLIKQLNDADINFLTRRLFPKNLDDAEQEEFLQHLYQLGLIKYGRIVPKVDLASIQNTNNGKMIADISAEKQSGSADLKKKLSPGEFIDNMKERGIQFDSNLMGEEEALNYLRDENQLFKILAYRANYQKDEVKTPAGKKEQYKNLQFAYLKELYEIDQLLGDQILKMTRDIEQQIKTDLIRSIDEDPDDDGYKLVTEFFRENPDVLINVSRLNSSAYCTDLVSKYGYPGHCPIWVFVELITFRQLIALVYKYISNKPIEPYNDDIEGMLRNVRFIRNAAAHNNCLIHHLMHDDDLPSRKFNDAVIEKVKSYQDRKLHSINFQSHGTKKKLQNRFIYDFLCLLYVYDAIMGPTAKKKCFTELQEFFDGRMRLHHDWFSDNAVITSAYYFMVKILYHLCSDNNCLIPESPSSMYSALSQYSSKTK